MRVPPDTQSHRPKVKPNLLSLRIDIYPPISYKELFVKDIPEKIDDCVGLLMW